RRHTRFSRDWSSDVCSSDLGLLPAPALTTWGFVGAYLRGSSPKSDDGLWNNGDREDGWAFYYGGNVSLGFAAGNYPLYKTLSAEIGRASCRGKRVGRGGRGI